MMLGDVLVIVGVVLAILAATFVDRAGRWLRTNGMTPPIRPLASLRRTAALLRVYRDARVQQGRSATLVRLFWLAFAASLVCFVAAFWLVFGVDQIGHE
jgi:hypothetical protein